LKNKPTLIAYYDEGWRYGYLIQRGYKWTRIRRILPKYTTRKRVNVRVRTADTKAVQQ
jgi:hypothetical protein